MIQTSDNEIWTKDSIHHDLLITDGTVTVSGTSYSISGATVTMTNDIIEYETFELAQSLCSTPQINFGSCESNHIEFIIHQNLTGLKNKVVKAYIIPDFDASKMVLLGEFKIYGDKLSSDRTKRSIVAYDKLYEILNADVTAWYNTILPNSNSSLTLAQFRASFLSHFNVTAESTTLVNDSMVIKRTIEPEKLSGADVIKAICEINGVFGKITNEGKFRFVELVENIDDALFPCIDLYPLNTLFPRDFKSSVKPISTTYYISVDYEEWLSEDITQLNIRTNDSDIGATVGTAGNLYVIQDNFLTYGIDNITLASIATNTLSKMVNRHYNPCTIEAIGNPCHEAGDPVRISTKFGNVFTYILERRLHGIQGLRDFYESQGEKEFDTHLNSLSSQIKQKVDRDKMVIDLDGQMSNTITIKKDSIEFHSDGALIVDTTNFKLDANGNAEFSGNISGALISSSAGVLAKTDYSYALMSTSGFETGSVSNDTLSPRIGISNDVMVFADPNGGSSSYLKYNEMMLYGSITCSGIITSGGWQVITYGQVTTKTKANLGDNDLILVLNSNS